MGIKYSTQTENIKARLHALPLLHVYVAPLPENDGLPFPAVHSAQRQAALDSTGNEQLRRERYYVWRLLEYAIEHSLLLNPEDISFSKDANGKWHCKEFFFSLSHSERALAVAVSKNPVGVDIEKIASPRSEKFPQKALNSEEYEHYIRLPEKEKTAFLIGAWTAKESIFKLGNEETFIPSAISANSGVRTVTVNVCGEEYALSVASEDNSSASIKQISL